MSAAKISATAVEKLPGGVSSMEEVPRRDHLTTNTQTAVTKKRRRQRTKNKRVVPTVDFSQEQPSYGQNNQRQSAVGSTNYSDLAPLGHGGSGTPVVGQNRQPNPSCKAAPHHTTTPQLPAFGHRFMSLIGNALAEAPGGDLSAWLNHLIQGWENLLFFEEPLSRN